jgi:homocysteine S-methyltransferase
LNLQGIISIKYILFLLSGSLGPYGACLGDGSEYSGNYIDKVSREDLKRWHLERIRRLAIRRVDLFAAETIPAVEEALAIIDALVATL